MFENLAYLALIALGLILIAGGTISAMTSVMPTMYASQARSESDFRTFAILAVALLVLGVTALIIGARGL